MREDLISYFKTLPLGNFSVSEELPRDEGGIALYVKNPRRIYVDREEYDTVPIIETLNGLDIHAEQTSVNVYFTADAKTIPANYSTLVSKLKLGKDINQAAGYTKRKVEVMTETDQDLLITRVNFKFSKLL
jgi:isochorismate hydrolase